MQDDCSAIYLLVCLMTWLLCRNALAGVVLVVEFLEPHRSYQKGRATMKCISFASSFLPHSTPHTEFKCSVQ